LASCQHIGTQVEALGLGKTRLQESHRCDDLCSLAIQFFIYEASGRRELAENMQETHTKNTPLLSLNAERPERDEELLRLTRRLDRLPDLEGLLRALPEELRALTACKTIALLYQHDGTVSWHVTGRECPSPPLQVLIPEWQDKILPRIHGDERKVILASLDQDPAFPEVANFFRGCGNQSLYVIPLNTALHRLGAICFGRKDKDAFADDDACFLSLIADYVSLAIDDRLNFARSEAVRIQLENERTKLKLILDLNNSVVSNLELRDVLQSISPSIRNVMRLDGVALILPDAEKKCLQTHALDFPLSKVSVRQDMSSPLYGSLPGQVFRSGKPWVGNIGELQSSGLDHRIAAEEGVETMCMLPLVRCGRVLGVLCLMRLHKNAFTPQDLEFLSQIAGQVSIAIDNALAYQQITELKDKLTQEKLYLQDEIRSEMNFEEIIGNSPVLRQVLRQVEAVAPTNSTVLIQGETGSGKELIARAVHNLSQRLNHAFVKLNCAAIPTGLLESELFGHEKGAFTGAIAQRIGRFELASQGTIFLDEISEIPLDLQPKLLRVLQEREFERLGSSRTLHTDARLIAATNRDLNAMVEEQRFRSDLFYRLNVFPIYVPPLRERKEDIPFLVRHFAQHFARDMTKEIHSISAETMNTLVSYPWPGNVRELQNVIERAVILSRGPALKVSLADLKAKASDTNGLMDRAATLEEIEKRHILSVLEQTNWVFAGPNGAAARLGIKRPTLQFRMQKLGISRPQKPSAQDSTNKSA
jgi:formate hydrogenlyase transcriptional activator